MPILVRDVDVDGSFGPGDDFVFFGLTAWDRLHPLPREKRYGRENAYFLTVRERGGALREGPVVPRPRGPAGEHVGLLARTLRG